MTEEEKYLYESLDYDPASGNLIHRLSGGRRKPGKIAGTKMRQPGKFTTYIQVQLNGKAYKGHRLAWFFTTGDWPTGHLDHIDGDGTNNRMSNLRLATNSQNMANRRRNTNSNSPYKGVCFIRKGKSAHG